MRPRQTIADLVAAGRLEKIEPDSDEAREILEHAQAHIASAERLADDDPAGAYQLLYDGARKAASADMLDAGYRAKDRPGAHAAVVSYAEEALANDADLDALANFDRLRRNRHRAEYGAMAVGKSQLEADLAYARAIVDAVTKRLDRDGARES